MFEQNRKNFIDKMKPNTVALFYSGKTIIKSADQTFPFEVNRNFYYLTGINQPNVILLLTKNAHHCQTFLFLEESDPQKVLWDGDLLSFSAASQMAKIALTNVKKIQFFHSFLFQMINPLRNSANFDIDGFYFDLSRQNQAQQANSWALTFCQKLLSSYPFLKIYNSSLFFMSLRQAKSVYEVNNIKKAISINCQALHKVITSLKPLMYENQITAIFHGFLEANQTKPSFDSIAASGKNVLILHYNRNNSQLMPNELLLIDAGVTYNHYSSDITRCYPISGVFTTLQKQIYNLVLKANKEIIAWVKPEHTFTQLNHYGKTILAKGLKELGLLEDVANIDQYCYHGLGHHLGLDIHDVCNYSDIIGENSVITVEPGLYFKQFNIGIRIEDNLLITKDGAINLSHQIPKEITEIQALMK
ncbi:aminopeptidase P family protein [Candidatus Phytoplasma solani]|uniref:aminopeptidase P family protein n=1 Tax=Candidatus Phytoplasma solani TaxID=69896 RepID=UPI00358F7591